MKKIVFVFCVVIILWTYVLSPVYSVITAPKIGDMLIAKKDFQAVITYDNGLPLPECSIVQGEYVEVDEYSSLSNGNAESTALIGVKTLNCHGFIYFGDWRKCLRQ